MTFQLKKCLHFQTKLNEKQQKSSLVKVFFAVFLLLLHFQGYGRLQKINSNNLTIFSAMQCTNSCRAYSNQICFYTK